MPFLDRSGTQHRLVDSYIISLWYHALQESFIKYFWTDVISFLTQWFKWKYCVFLSLTNFWRLDQENPMFIEPRITRVPSGFSGYPVHMAWYNNHVEKNYILAEKNDNRMSPASPASAATSSDDSVESNDSLMTSDDIKLYQIQQWYGISIAICYMFAVPGIDVAFASCMTR